MTEQQHEESARRDDILQLIEDPTQGCVNFLGLRQVTIDGTEYAVIRSQDEHVLAHMAALYHALAGGYNPAIVEMFPEVSVAVARTWYYSVGLPPCASREGHSRDSVIKQIGEAIGTIHVTQTGTRNRLGAIRAMLGADGDMLVLTRLLRRIAEVAIPVKDDAAVQWADWAMRGHRLWACAPTAVDDTAPAETPPYPFVYRIQSDDD